MAYKCYNLFSLPQLDTGKPVVQLRLKVKWKRMQEFLDAYDAQFGEIDAALGIKTLRFVHQTRHRFNLTILYQFPSREVYDQYYEKALERKDADELTGAELLLSDMVEDEEKLTFFGFANDQWGA